MARGCPAAPWRSVDSFGAPTAVALAHPLVSGQVETAVDPLVADAQAPHPAAESAEQGGLQGLSSLGTTV